MGEVHTTFPCSIGAAVFQIGNKDRTSSPLPAADMCFLELTHLIDVYQVGGNTLG